MLGNVVKLKVELKGPRQGTFQVECDYDVTIGEMKTQILEILEKNLKKPFVAQEKLYKVIAMLPDKGAVSLKDSCTIEQYKLKDNTVISV